jgi:hypothetical protein
MNEGSLQFARSINCIVSKDYSDVLYFYYCRSLSLTRPNTFVYLVLIANTMHSLLQIMERFVQVEALENVVEGLKKRVFQQVNDLEKKKGSTSVLATTRAALDRAVLALQMSQPIRKLTLENMEIMHVLGEGGWGTVWKVSVIT